MKLELHVIFHGLVQGVCFRSTLTKHATALRLAGTVKNLSDGTVEVYIQGTKEQLQTFLEKVSEEPGFARIDKATHEYSNPKKHFKHFQIIS